MSASSHRSRRRAPHAWTGLLALGVLVTVIVLVPPVRRLIHHRATSVAPAPPAAATVAAAIDEIDPSRLSGAAALEEVRRFLAVGPRPSGSPGAGKAAGHIVRRLEAFGLEPVTDVFTNQTPAGPIVFRNVTARVGPGDAATIVLGSHFDTKSGIDENFQGANDSGSSTGLLLEMARLLAAGPPRKGTAVLLAFLDGEECVKRYSAVDGLHGSRRLAAQLAAPGHADVRGVIILDMIGDRDLNVGIPRNSSRHLISLVFESARQENGRPRFSLARHRIIDDHVPFIEAGIPAVDLIDFEFGSAPGRNDYWHTVDDTLDKLSPDSLQLVGRVALRTLNALAARPAPVLP